MPVVNSRSVSAAWLEAIRHALSGDGHEIENLVVTVHGLEGGTIEQPAVRVALDTSLALDQLQEVRTVASTIFPSSLWRPAMTRAALYDRYKRLWPRLQRYRKNRRGTYFQRLIAYPEFSPTEFNQLEQVIGTYLHGNHRRSALQASLIVPRKDLNDARQQGFPCLQQVAFVPTGGLLKVVAYYPMQYMYERAYGNYLGLIELGRFVAEQMGLTLTSMTCIAIIAKADNRDSAQALVSLLGSGQEEYQDVI